MAAALQAQDFIKGWPHQELLNTEKLRSDLLESYKSGLDISQEALNYGDAANGAYMLGHPAFRKAMAGFLAKQYGEPVDWKNIMSTAGASMGTDIAIRVHCKAGDIAVVEEPTYYLSFTMIRDKGMSLMGVPIEDDGMDVNALEQLLKENPGKIKLVYTVPIHHNPTGATMSSAKREKLCALAREHDFIIIAYEAYQLLNYGPMPAKPLFYHDDPNDPHVLSVSTFSKLIGPGVKVGWIQAHEKLLNPLKSVGFIDSGNNPVIFSSCSLMQFIESGHLEEHINIVSKDLGERCDLMCRKLEEVGLSVKKPAGGYFIWVKSKGKTTGRTGECMCIAKDRFHEWMRLCFTWLPREKIEEGIEYLRE